MTKTKQSLCQPKTAFLVCKKESAVLTLTASFLRILTPFFVVDIPDDMYFILFFFNSLLEKQSVCCKKM